MGFPLPSGRLCGLAAHATAEASPEATFKIKVSYRTLEPGRMNSCFAHSILFGGTTSFHSWQISVAFQIEPFPSPDTGKPEVPNCFFLQKKKKFAYLESFRVVCLFSLNHFFHH